MQTHPTHETRVSIDASTYDEVCTRCGATDTRGSGLLGEPCPAATPPLTPGLVLCESVANVYGKPGVRIVARVNGRKLKSGEQRFTEVDKTYQIDRLPNGDVRLTKADGKAYRCNTYWCECLAFEFGRGALCKHILGLERLGEFPAPAGREIAP